MTWRDRAGFCRSSGRGTTPAVSKKSPLFCFSPRPLSFLAWLRYSFQSDYLSSAPAFCLPAVTLPPFWLPPLLRIPTRFLRRGWNISATILRLLGWTRRLLRQDPPSCERPSWHRAWGRASRQSSLAKRMLSGLFVCCVFMIFANARGLWGDFGGTPLTWHAHISLEVRIKIERGRLGGINKFRINNCWLTRVYCWRNDGVQEYHSRQNPSKGNEGEHHWHCYCHHRLSVRFPVPPRSATVVDPPSPLPYHHSGRRRRSAPSSPSLRRHELTFRPPYQTHHKFLSIASAMAWA